VSGIAPPDPIGPARRRAHLRHQRTPESARQAPPYTNSPLGIAEPQLGPWDRRAPARPLGSPSPSSATRGTAEPQLGPPDTAKALEQLKERYPPSPISPPKGKSARPSCAYTARSSSSAPSSNTTSHSCAATSHGPTWIWPSGWFHPRPASSSRSPPSSSHS